MGALTTLRQTKTINPWLQLIRSTGFLWLVFIVRQHVYACRARYRYGKFVRPSVCHTPVSYRNECICCQTLSAIHQNSSFLSATAITKFQEKLLSGGVIYRRWEKNAILYRNRRLSRKRHDIGPHGTLIGNHSTDSRSTSVGSNDFERP